MWILGNYGRLGRAISATGTLLSGLFTNASYAKDQDVTELPLI